MEVVVRMEINLPQRTYYGYEWKQTENIIMRKNIKITIASLIFATTCFGQTVTTQNQILLRTQTDSLNYAFGIINGVGIRNNYFREEPIDDCINEFIKSLDEGFTSDKKFELPDPSKTKYAEIIRMGNKIGTNLKTRFSAGLMGEPSIKIEIQLIMKGMEDAMRDNFSILSQDNSEKYLQKTLEVVRKQNLSTEDKQNKLAGEEFLAKNKLQVGVISTKSGLQYEILKKGNGATPTPTNTVRVKYWGEDIDGKAIYNNSASDEAISIKLAEVIKGLSEAIQLMSIGSKFRVYIPQELAYGGIKQSEIKPYSTLIYEIELLSIAE